MKRIVLFLLVACSQHAFAGQIGTYDLNDLSLDFAAPVVGSKTSLNNIPAGQIVFEQGSGFWGLTTSGAPTSAGSWILLGSTAGNSVISGGSERVERLTVGSACTSSPCSITSQSGTWASSVTRSSTGQYTVNFVGSTFSSAPSCTWQVYGSGALSDYTSMPTTSGFSFRTRDTSGNHYDDAFTIICMGPR